MVVSIVKKSGFIAPMNLGALGFGPRSDGRICIIEPLLYSLRILFIGTHNRLLQRKAPAVEILANRSDGHLKRIQLPDQLLHRNSCPQGKWQLQLVGATIFYCALKLPLLLLRQAAATAFRSPPKLLSDRFLTSFLIGLPPLACIGVVNADDLANFLVGAPSLAQLLLYLWFQLLIL